MNKKLVLFVVADAVVVGALAAWYFMSSSDHAAAPVPSSDEAAALQPPLADSEKAHAGEHKQRVHADDPQRAATLAVAGVVKASDGKPVAGATVDAYAVPAGDDVPDEDRVAREFLTKAFGRATADKLVGRSKKVRASITIGDSSRAGETMQDGMEMGMELLGDEGSMDGLVAMLQVSRGVAGSDDGAWPKAGSAATAADGTFRIEGLAGRIELRAKAPGHVRTKQRVAAGDVTVSMLLERGVRLAGVVTCEKEAVVGASVAIKGAAVTTGAGGRFEFDAAHVPTETVIVTADGCCAQGQTVSLVLDGPDKEIAIALDPAGAVAGHVSSVGGGPIAGARVALGGSGNFFGDMMGMGGGTGGRFDVPPPPATSDANGAFELRGLHVGATKLRVEAEGWLGATVSVDVKKGQTSAVEALLVRESVLAGAVRDEKGAAVAGAKVRVEVPARDGATGMIANMLGGTFRSALSDDKGNFAVHGLAEGERKVRVEAAKYLNLEDKVSIPAQAPATRDFVLHEGNKLAGTVNGPDGKPFGGAKIYAAGKPASGGGAGLAAMMGGGRKKDAVATSGADGAWSADGLQEGPFEVTASADGFLDGDVKDVTAGRTDVAMTLGAAATIRGRVVSLADSKPVVGATVARKSSDAPASAGRRVGRGNRGGPFAAMFGGRGSTVVTDADGKFEIKGLEPGDYELTGSMRGLADSDPLKLTCVAGQTIEGVEIALPPGVAVTGRVVEKGSGAAVAGAVVWAGKSDASPLAGFSMSDVTGGDPQAPANSINTRTDTGGRFVLEGVPPGKVNVEVRVLDHAPASLAGVAAPSADVVVEVSGGGAVQGRVTGADGNPVAGSQIMVMRGMTGQGVRQTKTDGNGDYLLEHLPSASYQVMLVDPQNPMAPTMAAVAVKDGETARHDFTKKAGGRQVGGAAMKDGKPLANAPIMLMGGSGLKMATTDDKGHFSFDGLDPGDYTVMLQSSFVNGGSTSKKVTVGSDGKVEDVGLQLSSAKIEGDVVDAETDKGIAGAQIALMEPASGAGSGADVIGAYRGQEGFTDERGHFAINDVQTGTFSLKATAAEYSAVTIDGVASGSRDVRVQLRRGVEFPVTVVGPDNAPVANATVQTVDASGNASMVFDATMSSITRAEGVARLRLAPGRYTLKITASDLLPAQIEIDTGSASATVHLDAGATVEVVATTDGTTPVAGARVKVLDATGAEIKPGFTMASFLGGNDRTDADGKFSRRGLPAGNATVVVTDAAGQHETRSDATLEMNRTRHLDVVLK